MAMLATVEAMQDGVLPCDDERLGTLGDETRRLSRLVDAMLQLSRMEWLPMSVSTYSAT